MSSGVSGGKAGRRDRYWAHELTFVKPILKNVQLQIFYIQHMYLVMNFECHSGPEGQADGGFTGILPSGFAALRPRVLLSRIWVDGYGDYVVFTVHSGRGGTIPGVTMTVRPGKRRGDARRGEHSMLKERVSGQISRL